MPETQPEQSGLRARISALGRRLAEENADKTHPFARLKRNIGESIISQEDENYRQTFRRYVGANALYMSGVAVALEAPGVALKIIGGVQSAIGLHNTVQSQDALMAQHNAIHQEQL